MFAELIFVALAIGGLLLIDNFSTSCALITCVLIIYYYVDYFPFVFNKYTFVLIASKFWIIISGLYRAGRQIYTFFLKIFSGHIESNCQSVSTSCCGDKADLKYEINILVSKVSQHYIHSWYDKLGSNKEFVTYLNSSINHTLVLLCSSISEVDKKKVCYDVLQVYLNFLSHFVEAKNKSEVFKTDNFKMKHWALKDKVTEWCYSQSLVSTLLDSFCPTDCRRSLHSKQSPVLHSVVVEILTQNLIHPLVNLLCDPTRLNLLLLKVLLNYVSNSGDVSFKVIKKENLTTKQPNIQPIIVLPNEVISSNSSTTNCTNEKDDNFLSISGNSALKAECFTDDENELTTPFISSGVKSCSNSNISVHNFHSDSGLLDCDSLPIFTCDTIKRSKSADFIRQIKPKGAYPQLKALSEKDYYIKLQRENNKMFVTPKPDSGSHTSVEEAEEAVELEGHTLFSDVKITDTFLQNETGLIPYTLYNIKYTALFHDTVNSTEVPCLVKKSTCVKRRFKEFVELHSKLEENPNLKSFIKGIKGPSKWLVLPFSNLDKKNIADRKIFLENYLNELCSSIPIAQSLELHQFLAYGDEHLYIRKSSDASVPRIDKIFVRGVKSAIDMFKTAVPGDEDVFTSEPVSDENIRDLKFQEHLLDFCNREPELDAHARNFLENASFQPNFEDNELTDIDSKKLKCSHLKSAGCCKCPILPENRFIEEKHPLANSIFELIAVAFNLSESNPGDITTSMKLVLFSLIKLLCASNIERILTDKLDDISEEHIAICFHLLHKYLWPDENNLLQTRAVHNFTDGTTLNQITECLEESIMKNLNFAVRNVMLEKINMFLSSLQHQETNKCLLYHVFDVIIANVLK